MQPDSVSIRPRIARSLASLNLKDSIDSILNVMNEPDREADLRAVWQTLLQQKEAELLLVKTLRGKVLSPSAATTGIKEAAAVPPLLLALEKAGNLAAFESPANFEHTRALARQAIIGGNPESWRDGLSPAGTRLRFVPLNRRRWRKSRPELDVNRRQSSG